MNIQFHCNGNPCRSHMAAVERCPPTTVMRETGVDIASQQSARLTDETPACQNRSSPPAGMPMHHARYARVPPRKLHRAQEGLAGAGRHQRTVLIIA